jgi:hypothetical protein
MSKFTAVQISFRRSSRHDLLDAFWLKIYPLTLGGGKTAVCRWHNPGGVQGDGEQSFPNWHHYRELRARRRGYNRNFLNIRAASDL